MKPPKRALKPGDPIWYRVVMTNDRYAEGRVISVPSLLSPFIWEIETMGGSLIVRKTYEVLFEKP